MKRLYEVEAKYYVMAENKRDAQAVCPALEGCAIFAFEPNSIDSDWWDAIPFNSDDGRTCGEIFEEQTEA